MDGRNCTGRKISLLNDGGDAAAIPSKIQLPYLTAHSRASSCTSTPSLSPQTPQLVRSSSSDSRALSTPSPLTPSFNSFESAAQRYLPPKQQAPQQPQQHHHHHHHHHHSQHQQHYYLHNHSYAKMDDQNASMYPPIPDATGAMPSAYPMPPQVAQQQPIQPQNPGQAFRASTSPSSEPSRVSNASAQSNLKAPQKKNQYPCPMAKQVGCNDFFTTSGHAARHAKKHTGKKDAFCPECNKAFTRKDNMEQHRRTHQNGRGSSRSTTEDSKVKKSTKASAKKTSVKNEPALEAAVQQQLADQAQAEQAQQVARAVEQVQVQPVVQPLPLATEQLLMPAVGPYYVGGMDPVPVPALPMAPPDMSIRPPLHRSQFASSLDYVAPIAAMIDPDALNPYSYPSPGLSNGLHSLALAADEHRRHSEEKSSSRTPSETGSDSKTP